MSALIRMLVIGPLYDQFQHIQNKVDAELVWLDKEKNLAYHAAITMLSSSARHGSGTLSLTG